MTTPPAAPQLAAPLGTFRQQLSATSRGARLARLLTVRQLELWGLPYDGETSEAAALVVAELAANAVCHGRVAGRDFALCLTLGEGTLRIEVEDARGECVPVPRTDPAADSETGRGLLLVEALSTAWGTGSRNGPGKTVWAELPAAVG
ncbi:ATP-binding protein [Streptomyces sp. NPDC058045]|uniref:ATP-binding protein n=1 Tax=Streptomyces sp. NPDC058045 TaxID=3346311 RepID=UPI0036E7B594